MAVGVLVWVGARAWVWVWVWGRAAALTIRHSFHVPLRYYTPKAAMGGDAHTISGLSGMGDLMLTAMSSQSRNQKCGQLLVKGQSVEAILKDMTVEGIPTASVAVAYADVCGLDA